MGKVLPFLLSGYEHLQRLTSKHGRQHGAGWKHNDVNCAYKIKAICEPP